MQIDSLGGGVFTLRGFLGPDACAELIAFGDRLGYGEAVISTDDGDQLLKDARNNDRIILDDAALSARLYTAARDHLPQQIDGWRLSGFNDRLRFYRYGSQQYFKWHQDGTFRKSDREESFLTFMVYLNDGYGGGHTQFKWDTVAPQAGMALVFPHRLMHQGSEVTSGVKYVLRTDVMYRAPDASPRSGDAP